MIVLDTNVVSEMMRSNPHANVVAWLDRRPARELFVTTVTEAEVWTGIAFLPVGRRREALANAAERAFGTVFFDRVLPFDRKAARQYAEIAALRRTVGRPISYADCQIAAVAKSRSATLATRNLRDFEEADIDIVNPWGQ